MKPKEDIKTELAQIREIISTSDFIKLLASRLPVESLDIDFNNRQYRDALYSLLTLFKDATASSWGIWQVKDPLIPFFSSLAKNDEYAELVIALHSHLKQIQQNISSSLKNSQTADDIQLSKLMNSLSTKLNNINQWIDDQFKRFSELKKQDPSFYYSNLYHSAFKQKNTVAQKELLTFFHGFEIQLKILRENRGKKFRQMYIDDENIKFWEKFNLMISHYYDKSKILEILSVKLLHGTKDENRYQFIEAILKSKNPLNMQLERYLVAKLPLPEQKPTLRLISSKGAENTQLIDLELEVFKPFSESDQYKP